MRKLTFLLIVFLNCMFAFAQTYSSVTSDKEIYDFLNWMTTHERKYEYEPKLKQKHISNKILSWDTTNFIIKDNLYFQFNFLYQRNCGTDTIFNNQDRDFIFRQYTAIKDSIWHNKFSKSKLLTTKNQKSVNRHYYSIPLFSVDKNYVFIQQQYNCGSECAYGGYYVYRRIDDKNWEYVTSVKTWIS